MSKTTHRFSRSLHQIRSTSASSISSTLQCVLVQLNVLFTKHNHTLLTRSNHLLHISERILTTLILAVQIHNIVLLSNLNRLLASVSTRSHLVIESDKNLITRNHQFLLNIIHLLQSSSNSHSHKVTSIITLLHEHISRTHHIDGILVHHSKNLHGHLRTQSRLQLTLTFVSSTELDIFGSSTKHGLSRRSLSGLHNTIEGDMESLVSNRVGSNRESKNKSQQYSVLHNKEILNRGNEVMTKPYLGELCQTSHPHSRNDYHWFVVITTYFQALIFYSRTNRMNTTTTPN